MKSCKTVLAAGAFGILVSLSPNSQGAENPAIKAMADYLAFVDYGGGTIGPEQIPAADWKRFHVVDTRDAAQYAKGHIPGAVNMEWRQVLERRGELPTDKPILLYCNTGSLSAQAGFALRVAGMDNVQMLQGGYEGWKAKGGFDAHQQASKNQP